MICAKPVIPILLIVFFSFSVSAQKVVKSDTVRISGKPVFFHIPSKEEIQQEINEVQDQVREDLREIMDDMKSKQFISDNVITDVSLEVIGDAVLDLKLTYEYSLKNDTILFQTDDFTLGEYRVEKSNAALVMTEIMKKTVDGQLDKYIKPGQQISFTISGSADAVRIRDVIQYTGEFGPEVREDCEIQGSKVHYTINEQTDIQTNYQLAFMRSYSVRDHILKNVRSFYDTDNSFNHEAYVSEFKGGKYRRVTVEIIIHDAFERIIPVK